MLLSLTIILDDTLAKAPHYQPILVISHTNTDWNGKFKASAGRTWVICHSHF